MGNEYLIGSPRNKGLGTRPRPCNMHPILEGAFYFLACIVLVGFLVSAVALFAYLLVCLIEYLHPIIDRMDAFFASDEGIDLQMSVLVLVVVVCIGIYLRNRS